MTNKDNEVKELRYCHRHGVHTCRLGSIHVNEKDEEVIKKHIAKAQEDAKAEEITENTSDGYHTFKELYEFRKIYNATLFNEWYKQGKFNVHKSYYHSDGSPCFGGGWFIVVATLPTGDISNHYENKDWSLFDCEVRETAKKWDGHTSQDVINRLQALSKDYKREDLAPTIGREDFIEIVNDL